MLPLGLYPYVAPRAFFYHFKSQTVKAAGYVPPSAVHNAPWRETRENLSVYHPELSDAAPSSLDANRWTQVLTSTMRAGSPSGFRSSRPGETSLLLFPAESTTAVRSTRSRSGLAGIRMAMGEHVDVDMDSNADRVPEQPTVSRWPYANAPEQAYSAPLIAFAVSDWEKMPQVPRPTSMQSRIIVLLVEVRQTALYMPPLQTTCA